MANLGFVIPTEGRNLLSAWVKNAACRPANLFSFSKV